MRNLSIIRRYIISKSRASPCSKKKCLLLFVLLLISVIMNDIPTVVHMSLQKFDDGIVPVTRSTTTDKYKRYVVLANVHTSEIVPKTNDVTLMVNYDMSQLYNLIDLATDWKGPIQSVLYLQTRILVDLALMLLNQIRECHPDVESHVTFHVIHPTRYSFLDKFSQYHLPSTSEIFSTNENTESQCSNVVRKNIDLLGEIARQVDPNSKNIPDYITDFPNPLANNVDRQACLTRFYLVMDGDMKPSYGLREDFVKFAEWKGLNSQFAMPKHYPNVGPPMTLRGLKQVLVFNNSLEYISFPDPVCRTYKDFDFYPPDIFIIPTFEYNGTKPVPRTMDELMEAVREGTAAPFYHIQTPQLYSMTCHQYWLKLNHSKQDCAYRINYTYRYEPFHIGWNDYEPMLDVRFSGHSHVKHCLSVQLAAYGYNFNVMTKGFIIHRGWKTKEDKVDKLIAAEYAAQERYYRVLFNKLQSNYKRTRYYYKKTHPKFAKQAF